MVTSLLPNMEVWKRKIEARAPVKIHLNNCAVAETSNLFQSRAVVNLRFIASGVTGSGEADGRAITEAI
jgi:hypothetical protein